MPNRYAALLRAISNVSMAPFRAALEELGFEAVESFGMSGNLMFDAPRTPVATLERRIAAKLDKVAIVRSATAIRKAAVDDPFIGRSGAAVMFLARPPSAAGRQALADLDTADERPVLKGGTLYFVHPVRRSGGNAPTDFERLLGVKGTIRSSKVVKRLAEKLADETGRKPAAAG